METIINLGMVVTVGVCVGMATQTELGIAAGLVTIIMMRGLYSIANRV